MLFICVCPKIDLIEFQTRLKSIYKIIFTFDLRPTSSASDTSQNKANRGEVSQLLVHSLETCIQHGMENTLISIEVNFDVMEVDCMYTVGHFSLSFLILTVSCRWAMYSCCRARTESTTSWGSLWPGKSSSRTMTLGMDGCVSCKDHTRTISVTNTVDKFTVHSICCWSGTDLVHSDLETTRVLPSRTMATTWPTVL